MHETWEFALCLLVAHLVGDFAFRSRADVGQPRPVGRLWGHAAMIALLGFLLAGRWEAWRAPLVICATHGLIDLVMARRSSRSAAAFGADQAAHGLMIAAVALAFDDARRPSVWTTSLGGEWPRGLVFMAGAIGCIWVTGMLVGYWVRPFLEEIERPETPDKVRGLKAGGRIIGQWERAIILLLVLMNQTSGIGFLIAAKSIFRFGELKDRENRMEAEYITIGTLMSFALAIAMAWGTVTLLRR